MPESELDQHVAAVRRFNRFYTEMLGVLQECLLDSPFSLTEARVLFELANRHSTTARELGDNLGLDQGYLSRILGKFGRQGLIEKERDGADGRQSNLSLSAAGRKAFAVLDRSSHDETARLLETLTIGDRRRLMGAMGAVEKLLARTPAALQLPYVLRPPHAGDMGWVVQRHGELYAHEYGWDEQFEALVAGIAAKFLQDFDPKRERCWIAERDGENVGCVMVVKASDDTAKLRLLLVDPKARGLGIGRQLVAECVRFARAVAYKKITLWTNDVLHAARHIYEATGFQLTRREPHHSFGHELVGETWELEL